MLMCFMKKSSGEKSRGTVPLKLLENAEYDEGGKLKLTVCTQPDFST
jgi:hypothetical protein